MRQGRLTYDDMRFIESNWKKMSYTEIAKSLDRSIPSIKKYIDTKIKSGNSIEARELKVEYDIKSRPYRNDIEAQFEKEELPLFIYHWEKTISQFKDDVLPTEELQIVEMIKMEILMNRMLKKQKTVMNEISSLQTVLLEEQKKPIDEKNLVSVGAINTQLMMMHQAQQAASKEFQEMSTKKLKILEQLKATRNQRYAKIENSRQTFNSFLASLIADKDKRREWGITIEKRRQAAEQEMKRISEYHTYLDGVVDQPLLTPENVKDDNVI